MDKIWRKTWRNYKDIPQNVKDFMDDTTKSKVFYFDDAYHCPICKCTLDNNICPSCQKEYRLLPKYTIYGNFDKGYQDANTFYVFDIIDNNILLYVIDNLVTVSKSVKESTFTIPSYDSDNIITVSNSIKECNFSIRRVYKISKDKMLDLKYNDTIDFKWIRDNILNKTNLDEYIYGNMMETYISIMGLTEDYDHVYTDNLDILKETDVYKNSRIWELKDYLNDNEIVLATITFLPICVSNFYDLIVNKKCNIIFLNEEVKYLFDGLDEI